MRFLKKLLQLFRRDETGYSLMMQLRIASLRRDVRRAITKIK